MPGVGALPKRLPQGGVPVFLASSSCGGEPVRIAVPFVEVAQSLDEGGTDGDFAQSLDEGETDGDFARFSAFAVRDAKQCNKSPSILSNQETSYLQGFHRFTEPESAPLFHVSSSATASG